VRNAQASHYVRVDVRRRVDVVSDAAVEVVHLERGRGGAAQMVRDDRRAVVEVAGADIAHVAAFDVNVDGIGELHPALAANEIAALVPERRSEVELHIELRIGARPARRGLCLRRPRTETEKSHETHNRNPSQTLHQIVLRRRGWPHRNSNRGQGW